MITIIVLTVIATTALIPLTAGLKDALSVGTPVTRVDICQRVCYDRVMATIEELAEFEIPESWTITFETEDPDEVDEDPRWYYTEGELCVNGIVQAKSNLEL